MFLFFFPLQHQHNSSLHLYIPYPHLPFDDKVSIYIQVYRLFHCSITLSEEAIAVAVTASSDELFPHGQMTVPCPN